MIISNPIKWIECPTFGWKLISLKETEGMNNLNCSAHLSLDQMLRCDRIYFVARVNWIEFFKKNPNYTGDGKMLLSVLVTKCSVLNDKYDFGYASVDRGVNVTKYLAKLYDSVDNNFDDLLSLLDM